MFNGYGQDPAAILAKTFEEVDGYDEPVILRNIDFTSHCEHHMMAYVGRAHIAYLPARKVVGISKLARLVDVYAKRLQVQEAMTMQIATTIHEVLEPKGVAVMIEGAHTCMTLRGTKKEATDMVTSKFLGVFAENKDRRAEVLELLKRSS